MTTNKFIPLILTLAAAVTFDASARYKGDFNGDDRVDLADMVHLAKAIKAGSTDKELDLNVSGTVDENDLHRLADIIISGKLTEDSGMNVGIGGWEDSGEDFGGTVRSLNYGTRSLEDTRFFMRDPQFLGSDTFSMGFGLSEGTEAPAAVLFCIRLPQWLIFDPQAIVELDPTLSESHRLYGTPKFVKEHPEEEWNNQHVLRFIVFSPDLTPLPSTDAKIGNIHYIHSGEDAWDQPYFINCQTAASTGECCDIPEHASDYYGKFMPIEVISVWFEQSEMNLVEGDSGWLWANIDPWDATDQTLVWTSGDDSVATVFSEDGRNATVTAVKEGETVISATSSNGLSASCLVKVERRVIEMESLLLDAEVLSLEVGATHQFEVTILPEETTDRELEWWSDDETIAKVDGNGLLTLTGEGSTTLHVRSSVWTHIEALCRIEVTADVESIIADDTPCDIFSSDGRSLRKGVHPSEIRNLNRGFYLIRRNGKIAKILK